jgi:hypothetical protein
LVHVDALKARPARPTDRSTAVARQRRKEAVVGDILRPSEDVQPRHLVVRQIDRDRVRPLEPGTGREHSLELRGSVSRGPDVRDTALGFLVEELRACGVGVRYLVTFLVSCERGLGRVIRDRVDFVAGER